MVKNDPSTGKGEQTRAQIFESALALFREQGFDATTMQQVAERAEVAKGAAYYYFPGKEAIIQAYYETLQAEQERLCGEVFAKTGNLRARLDAAMQIKFDLVQNDRKLLGVVFRYTGEPEHPLSCLGSGTAEIRRRSMQVFRDALNAERLPPDLMQLLPLALWALQMGLLVMFLYDNSKGQQRTRTLSEGAIRLTLRLLTLQGPSAKAGAYRRSSSPSRGGSYMNDPEEKPQEKTTSAQWALVTLIVSIASASFLYRALVIHRFKRTAALFIGLPSLLAVVLALTPKQKTAWGSVLKGMTLFLLLSGPILGEGFICILMASPVFLVVGLVFAAVADRVKKNRDRMLGCLAVFTIPMCLEGVFPQLTFNRMQTVSVTRIVAANISDVERALQCSPHVAQPLPLFLRIGFPVPLAAEGCGLSAGSLRTIHFSGAEGKPPGDVVMRATESRPGFASFTVVSDSTKLSHWMEWEQSAAEWRAIDANHTQVTWHIVFERRLDPAWYFTPLERAAVHEAARYMIQANATPGLK